MSTQQDRLLKYANLASTALSVIGTLTKTDRVKDAAKVLSYVTRIYDAYDKGQTLELAEIEAEIKGLTETTAAIDAEVDAMVKKRKG
jgi:hypothetical protein